MIGVMGAGAFGTALAVVMARHGARLTLWGRAVTPDHIAARLPGVILPDDLHLTTDATALADCTTILLAVPMQQLTRVMSDHADILAGKALVACCKGVDLTTGQGPSALIAQTIPDATPALLSGPSFAADIARGLPTALVLACADSPRAQALQAQLSTDTLRLYRTDDLTGVELGGALKNVIAIASGTAIGAGLGESARAALMTRGFAEMQRLALTLGARPDTLAGLSGFGDLVLTCTSAQSRNYAYGLTLGQSGHTDTAKTVEGRATAQAVHALAAKHAIDMPITAAVAGLVTGHLTVKDATQTLLSRSLKQE